MFPRVAESVARLNQAGLKVVLVTNQSGIARGYFSLKDLEAVHAALTSDLARAGAWLDDVLFCPHHPDDGCRCRKPRPGMIEQAAARHAIDAAGSYVVGDQLCDIELARGVGAKGILVTTGPRADDAPAGRHATRDMADFVAPCFFDAVSWILRDRARSLRPGPPREKAPSAGC